MFVQMPRQTVPERQMPNFGRYECLFRLASGGMANVYVARRRGEGGFEKHVAIKCLHAFLGNDAKFVTMFHDEARLTACIHSPHVVSTLDLGRTDRGLPFLVMELVIGTTLQRLAANRQTGPLPLPIALEWLAQTASGLHDAHRTCSPHGAALGIVHRDVSPQNILVGADGRARLSDFGVATADGRLTQTYPGEVKGKWAYFAPERVANQPLDLRSDVFSLGIVAWEALAGERLFYRRDPLEILSEVTSGIIPALHQRRPAVPAAVAKVVQCALQRDISERYPSAGAFAAALRTAALATVGLAGADAASQYVRTHGASELQSFAEALAASSAESCVDDWVYRLQERVSRSTRPPARSDSRELPSV